MSVELNEDQVYALYDMENWWYKSKNQVYELSGPAGSGKTFLVKYFIEKIGLDIKDVKFLAYMGKAAMALARTGLPAQTIHSLIYEYRKVVVVDENGLPIIDEKTNKPRTRFDFFLRDEYELKGIKLLIVDEGSMVNDKIGKDLLSYGIPVIVLGDLNQLPPVFGEPFFLKNPDYILTKIMRQSENNPIIYLSQQILNDKPLKLGVYGNSAVIRKSDLDEYKLQDADIILTSTNRLREKINKLFREEFMDIKNLDVPNVGEKVICRRNYWNKSINGIYLINGMSGTFTYTDISSLTRKKTIECDFQPDFLANKYFKNLKVSIERMFVPLGTRDENPYKYMGMYEFEFAYAITTHLSQGSQYNKVLYLDENTVFDNDMKKKLQYTAITRAVDSITIVL